MHVSLSYLFFPSKNTDTGLDPQEVSLEHGIYHLALTAPLPHQEGFPVTEDKTEGRKAQNHAATEGDCSEGETDDVHGIQTLDSQ